VKVLKNYKVSENRYSKTANINVQNRSL